MFLALANNPSHFVDYGESRLEQNDLEVEEILNEIGFFANDDTDHDLMSGEMMPSISDPMATSMFAPVSPEHYSVDERSEGFSSESNYSSSDAENMQTFCVPNPIASFNYNNGPAPITPRVSGEADKKTSKIVKKTSKNDTSKMRKRKLSETAPAQRAKVAAPVPKVNKEEELTEEQLEERRQRNREHAKRSRQRKKCLTSTLQQSVDDLKAENSKLREQIYSVIGEDKAESILEAREERVRAKFMQGLQNPGNRVLDDSTISFLKGLRKNITTSAMASNKNPRKN